MPAKERKVHYTLVTQEHGTFHMLCNANVTPETPALRAGRVPQCSEDPEAVTCRRCLYQMSRPPGVTRPWGRPA